MIHSKLAYVKKLFAILGRIPKELFNLRIVQAEKHKMIKVLTNVTELRNESQHYKTDDLCMTWIRFIEYIALTWLQSNPWIPKFSNYDALERVYITNFIISIVKEVKLGEKKGILWLMTMYAAAAAAKLLQSCPTLCDPMDCSPPEVPLFFTKWNFFLLYS